MNDQEKSMAKAINELAIFMAKGSGTVQENEHVKHAIDLMSQQLIIIVGRRTIKESKK